MLILLEIGIPYDHIMIMERREIERILGVHFGREEFKAESQKLAMQRNKQ